MIEHTIVNPDEILLEATHILRATRGEKARVSAWYGRRGTGTVTKYVDYFSGASSSLAYVIDTESAKYPMTKHANLAIAARREHCISVLLASTKLLEQSVAQYVILQISAFSKGVINACKR